MKPRAYVQDVGPLIAWQKAQRIFENGEWIKPVGAEMIIHTKPPLRIALAGAHRFPDFFVGTVVRGTSAIDKYVSVS